LLYRVKRLNTDVAVLRAFQQTPVGTTLPPILGHNLSGDRITLALNNADNRRTVAFVLSPSCHVCDANWPIWQSLLKTLDPFNPAGLP
jgi:hypothetical protein